MLEISMLFSRWRPRNIQENKIVSIFFRCIEKQKYSKQIGISVIVMSPIDRKEFEAGSVNLKQEIIAFLKANKDKAYTADEIISGTSFHTRFDLEAVPKTSVYVAANFVAFLNDLANDGQIKRKVVGNRMYFTA
jgi:hypothetical protein